MTSRRDFFRVAGVTTAGGGAVFLAACEDDDETGGGGASSQERDVRILNSALGLEHTAVAAYTAGAALLKGPALKVGRQFLAHEKEHAAGLERAIRDLGGTPNRPRRGEEYRRQFPNLRSQRDVLRFAVDLENAAVEAYIDSIPRLSSPDLRQTAAAIASNEAEHVSVLLGALNPGDPAAQVPQAFVTGIASVS